MKNKIAIITSLFGNYEKLHKPNVIHKNADYFAFIENKTNDNIHWNQIVGNKFSDCHRFSNRRNAKIYKILPEMFLDYEFFIWTDATHEVIQDPESICQKYIINPNCDMAVFEHRLRNCIYEEAEEIKKIHADIPQLIDNQVEIYKNNYKFPEKNGLYELPGFVKRVSDKTKSFSLQWWEHICKFSSRDQISFPVCAKIHKLRLCVLPGKTNDMIKNGIIHQIRPHRHEPRGKDYKGV